MITPVVSRTGKFLVDSTEKTKLLNVFSPNSDFFFFNIRHYWYLGKRTDFRLHYQRTKWEIIQTKFAAFPSPGLKDL